MLGIIVDEKDTLSELIKKILFWSVSWLVDKPKCPMFEFVTSKLKILRIRKTRKELLQHIFFNWPSSFSVLKRKIMCRQPKVEIQRIFLIRELLVGCKIVSFWS